MQEDFNQTLTWVEYEALTIERSMMQTVIT